jgi:hypothetical protein
MKGGRKLPNYSRDIQIELEDEKFLYSTYAHLLYACHKKPDAKVENYRTFIFQYACAIYALDGAGMINIYEFLEGPVYLSFSLFIRF